MHICNMIGKNCPYKGKNTPGDQFKVTNFEKVNEKYKNFYTKVPGQKHTQQHNYYQLNIGNYFTPLLGIYVLKV